MNLKKMAAGIGALVILGVALITAPMYLEKVDAGEYKIVQQPLGEIQVLDRAGWQYTGFTSNITAYNEAGIFYFSSDDSDGGNGVDSQPVEVRFSDGVKGWVNGNVQFRLPRDKETRVELHKLYGRDYEAVVHNLIVKSVKEAIIRSAPHFKGEEAYSYRGADFINLVQRQITEGIYATYTEQKIVKDVEENEFIENFVKIRVDKDGNNIISKNSKLAQFNVELVGLSIEKVVLDPTAMKYIDAKKTAEFDKIQNRAKAEASKQKAITAKEEGKANVATAKAEADVIKQRAVTEAEKNKEVAELQAQELLAVATLGRQTAEQEAEAMIVTKKAEAAANALLVKAGLTPREKAEFEMKTKIGVAREVSGMNVPQIVIAGGGNGGAINPLDMVGMNQALEIVNKLKK